MNVTIPLIWVNKTMYLVGNKLISLEKKGEYVTARVSGGYSRFDQYIQENHQKIERDLVFKMIQSQQSLEWICEALINGKKIPSTQIISAPLSARKYKHSPKQQIEEGEPLQIFRKSIEEEVKSKNTMSYPRRSYSK